MGVPVLDAAGNQLWQQNGPTILELNLATGRSEQRYNPRAFDPNNQDIVGNVARWREATAHVIGAEVRTVLQDILDGKVNHLGRIVDTIKRKKEARGPGGEGIRQAKEEMTAQITTLEADRTTLANQEKGVGDYQRKVAEITAEIERLRAEQRRAEASVTIISPGGGPIPVGTTIEAALQEALGSQSSVAVVINGTTISSLFDAEATLDGQINADFQHYIDTAINPLLVGRNSPDVTQLVNDEQGRILSRYQARIENIENRKQLVNDVLQRIQTARDGIIDKQGELTSDATEGRREATGFLIGLPAARTRIESWTIPPPAVGAPAVADLRTIALQTETFDTLMQRINVSYGVNPAFGWPEGENGDADHRTMLLNAMTEARAGAIEPRVFAPTPGLSDVLNPSLWGLAEVDLLALPSQEIRDRMTARHPAIVPPFGGVVPPIPQIATIDALKSEVASRIAARQRAMQRVTREIEGRRRTLETQVTNLDTNGLPTPRIDAIGRAVDRYAQIRERVTTMTGQELNDFLSLNIAADPTRYLAAEQGQFEATVNMYRLIFGHQEDDQSNVTFGNERGPNAAFRRNFEALNSQQLAESLRERFLLRIMDPQTGAPRPVATLREAIYSLRWEMGLPVGTPPVRRPAQITLGELASFLSETLIFGRIEPTLATADV